MNIFTQAQTLRIWTRKVLKNTPVKMSLPTVLKFIALWVKNFTAVSTAKPLN